MANQRHLSKAPAREALIDIQFEPNLPIETIELVERQLIGHFGQSTPMMLTNFGVNVAKDGKHQTTTNQSSIGYRLDSTSPPHVLQCRINGFTFSRLPPYSCWDDLRNSAKEAWDVLVEIAPSFEVTRLAVRYINEIKIPLPFENYSDYLICPPEIPPNLPQGIAAFLQRVVIPDKANDCNSIITLAQEQQGIISDEGIASVSILLDVDVSRMRRIASNNTEAIWTSLDELRVQKNRIFFEHLTEKTVEMYQ